MGIRLTSLLHCIRLPARGKKSSNGQNMRIYFLATLALISLNGCAAYHPKPINDAAVKQSLTPPSFEAVRIEAREIKHPILQPIDFSKGEGLSPQKAAVLAVLANPALRAARDRRGVAQAQLFQAGILPNPGFSYSLDVPTGGNTGGTVNAYALGLTYELIPLITRGARLAAARSEAAAVDLDVAWQEWQIAEAAKLHVYNLAALDGQLRTAQNEEKDLEENLDVVKRALDLGDLTVVDLAAAETALQRARALVLTIEQQRENERLLLNQSVGFPPDQRIALQRDLVFSPHGGLPPVAEITQGLEARRLDLLALKMGYESQEARLRVAILSQFPRLAIGPSRARDTSNVMTTGFGISIDVPIFDRSQGRIAIERATRQQLFDEYMARLFDARAEVATISADIRSIERQIAAAQEAIPIATNLIRNYRRALLEGNADVVTYYNARSELLSKQIELVKLKADLAGRIVALEIASGQCLDCMPPGG
jgi:cobalt-zinc-cadmium efflux system outer membrane protein